MQFRWRISALLAILAVLAFNSDASANTITDITIPDFSFESATTSSMVGPSMPAVFTGWTAGDLGNQTNWTYGQAPVNAFTSAGTSDGSYFLEFFHHYGGQTYFLETTNPVATIDNNATYTLTVALGVEAGQGIGTQTDQIELLSGTTVLALTTPALVPSGTFADFTATFNTLAGNNAAVVGQGLSIELISSGLGGSSHSNTYSDFDNVRLTEDMVPEPSTWALLLLGAGGMAFLVRRRANV